MEVDGDKKAWAPDVFMNIFGGDSRSAKRQPAPVVHVKVDHEALAKKRREEYDAQIAQSKK